GGRRVAVDRARSPARTHSLAARTHSRSSLRMTQEHSQPSLAAGATGSDPAVVEHVMFELKRLIVGQDHLLERVLVALLSRGHVLIEGVPGLAKTATIKALARVTGGTFGRIQFTPDLVPADLIGTRIYNGRTGAFTTELGPVFANLL